MADLYVFVGNCIEGADHTILFREALIQSFCDESICTSMLLTCEKKGSTKKFHFFPDFNVSTVILRNPCSGRTIRLRWKASFCWHRETYSRGRYHKEVGTVQKSRNLPSGLVALFFLSRTLRRKTNFVLFASF